jgi:hypothetical protein
VDRTCSWAAMRAGSDTRQGVRAELPGTAADESG